MTETLEFLNSLNWFLQPFSKLIIFFFTTKFGIISLLTFLLLFIGFNAHNELKTRKLAYLAIGSYGGGNTPFLERLYIIGKVISNTFFKIISNVPTLLFVVIFLIFVVGLSSGIQTMDDFVKNQEKIKELKSIVKQLNQRYKVAEIKVLNYNLISNKTDLEIKFYDYAKQGYSNENQDISIQGNDIYFDAVILNFEYSEISSGTTKNIVLPYRIFSEKVPQENGISLNLKDENGIPLIFKRNENEIYGMESEKYKSGIKEIMSYLTDDKKAKMAGIRSIYGNAVHKTMRKGETYTIWIEQTGGLVIKNAAQF
ncbi:MAG: hypothetical protein JXR51_10420 [Bacteroidales bacterium]|nr:hypothetical protein [Bacteroidales bacterium]MBN2757580.1 hypothetical protein [Bacteroidales bacterium]